MPASAYQKPDIVLGQLLAHDTQRNAGGEVDAFSLLYPFGVWSDVGENLEAGKLDSERLYWTFAVSVLDDKLFVADMGNHRIVFYDIN